MKYLIIILFTSFLACNDIKPPVQLKYPETTKVDTIDNYFGTLVPDPYRWLEDDHADDVAKWVEEQNKVTQDYLKTIPYRDQLEKRFTDIWNYPKYTTPFREGDNYYYYYNNGLQNQSVLHMTNDLNAEGQLLLDPNTFSKDGTSSLAGAYFSHDGNYLAYAVSSGGSDWKEFFVMDVRTKEKLSDHIQWVKFSGASWFQDGFFYSRYDAPSEDDQLKGSNEYHKLYYHKLGTDQNEDKLIHENKDRAKRNFYAQVSEDDKYLVVSVSEGAAGNNMLLYKDLRKPASKLAALIPDFESRNYMISTIGDNILLFSNRNAPKNQLVLIDPNNMAEANWKVLIPEAEEVLDNAIMAGGKIIASYMKDASHRLYVFNESGKKEKEVKLPSLGKVAGMHGKKKDSLAFYSFTSYAYPGTTYKYDISSGESVVYKESEVDFNSADYTTEQVFYKSKDGTSVPIFITYKNGIKKDGNNPTLLYGYGGFNISINPSFSLSRTVLLENGGILAVANLRGGSEYGEEWHKMGMREKKQNVFDDFISAAEYLISENYTSSEKLAISGRSNGGLLVGACMTQRPDLFKVALPGVGVLDMLRFHKFTIGWAWTDEYGSSDDSLDFNYLYKYSPLHNLTEGNHYPATLVSTADHDDRVVPAHSFKFISTLQEKHQGSNPVLIRIETKAGHGAGKSTTMKIKEAADVWAFVFNNLGVTPSY